MVSRCRLLRDRGPDDAAVQLGRQREDPLIESTGRFLDKHAVHQLGRVHQGVFVVGLTDRHANRCLPVAAPVLVL